VIDIASFVGEVCGYQKQGTGYGYTGQLGYHPLVATRGGSGDVLHRRNRKGKANTQRGNPRFVDELLARVRRAGATGTILIRADTGFENQKLFKTFDARPPHAAGRSASTSPSRSSTATCRPAATAPATTAFTPPRWRTSTHSSSR
jgi:hypothetical protein